MDNKVNNKFQRSIKLKFVWILKVNKVKSTDQDRRRAFASADEFRRNPEDGVFVISTQFLANI